MKIVYLCQNHKNKINVNSNLRNKLISLTVFLQIFYILKDFLHIFKNVNFSIFLSLKLLRSTETPTGSLWLYNKATSHLPGQQILCLLWNMVPEVSFPFLQKPQLDSIQIQLTLSYTITKCHNQVVIAPASVLLHLEHFVLKSSPRDWLSWLRFFMVFLSSSRQILRQYLKASKSCFIPHVSNLLFLSFCHLSLIERVIK
jgi:hypothetical protein